MIVTTRDKGGGRLNDTNRSNLARRNMGFSNLSSSFFPLSIWINLFLFSALRPAVVVTENTVSDVVQICQSYL